MNRPGDSAGSSTGRSRAPRTPPGPPTEVWLWRIIPKKGRGEHRDFADNVRVEHWEDVWRYRHPGAGRYRIEFRDARRAIVRVEYANVPDPRSDEPIVYTTGRVRRPKRTVPPARPAWEARPAPPAPPRSAPTQPRGAPTAKGPTPSANPPLRPPGGAPEGTRWQLRKDGTWKPFDRNLAPPTNYCLLWLPTEEVILVYSPAGTWPGYKWGHLRDGRACLVPKEKRP